MDYLEGSLIGPVWSDTEYKRRRHLGSHIILSVLMLLFFVLAFAQPQWTAPFIFVSYPVSLIFFDYSYSFDSSLVQFLLPSALSYQTFVINTLHL